MPRNSYLGLANLGTHPAFRWEVAALVCPYTRAREDRCDAEPFSRVADYHRHFLGHNPSQSMAWQWLSGREYDRQAPKRGWPTAAEVYADRKAPTRQPGDASAEP